ncbi:MAG: phosphopantothenoylcysteine decarboxylase, partial [Candidatus Omnitrophota bacterium]
FRKKFKSVYEVSGKMHLNLLVRLRFCITIATAISYISSAYPKAFFRLRVPCYAKRFSMKILITAGPTWVKIDEVRVLTTIFTGNTGLYLANEFAKSGHQVTLLVNPHCFCSHRNVTSVRIIPYRYFDELKAAITGELRARKYDAIIHSAAISDYVLKKTFQGKIPSGKKPLTLEFLPAGKIITTIRKLAPASTLIQFKLEAERRGLLARAYESLRRNKSDYVVANAYCDLRSLYRAFLLDKDGGILLLDSKKALANALIAACRGRI